MSGFPLKALRLPLALAFAVSSAAAQPLLRLSDAEVSASPTLIAYGDTRFTDPAETDASNPKVRKWLVDRIAAEKPRAVLMSGDVPWHGQEAADYAVFASETAPWRAAGIFVSPALGNHELNGNDKEKCLENWWTAFPKLRGHRWYSVALGSRILVLNLDSDLPLVPGSEQYEWIKKELSAIEPAVRFILLNLHHPPAADYMAEVDADHNARPNEIPLKDLIRESPARRQARFVVVAGHIHNYERFESDDTVYLVSGGGGAKPRVIRRGPEDLYKNPADVNYHYVKFALKGDTLSAEMVRVADPAAAQPSWEVRDRFEIKAIR